MNEEQKTQEKQKIDILSLSREKFLEIYREKMIPKILQAQQILGKKDFTSRLATASFWFPKVFCLLAILFISVFTYGMWRDCSRSNHEGLTPFVMLFVMAFVWIWIPYRIFGGKKVHKDLIRGIFFSSIDVDYVGGHVIDKFFWERFCNVVNRLPYVGLFSDEFLRFTYRGSPLSFGEFTRILTFKRTKVFAYTIGKKFQGETILISSERLFTLNFRIKQRVFLEDPIFNKHFKILTSDQVDARYLLTSAFMNRLLDFQKKYNCIIDVLFSNNPAPDLGNVFISITSNKNFFDLPSKWFDDMSPEPLYKIIEEVKEIAEIFDTLKLDQDIGM